MDFHGDGWHPLVQEEVAPFRVLHPTPEARLTVGSCQQDPQAGLEEGMKIDEKIVTGGAELLRQPSNFVQYGKPVAAPEPFEAAAAVPDEEAVERQMPSHRFDCGFLNEPVDPGLGKVTAQRGQGGQGMNDIADGARLHNKDVQARLSQAVKGEK